MKNYYKQFVKRMLVVGFFVLAFTGNAQHFTVTIDNFTSTSNTLEFDLVLMVDQPVQGVRFASLSSGLFFNTGILNGGTPCATADCGSFVTVPGHRSSQLTTLLETHSTVAAMVPGHLRVTQAPLVINGVGTGVDLLPGAYTLERFKFTNTVPWTANSDVQLWLAPITMVGATNTVVLFYPYGGGGNVFTYTTTNPANGAGLTLGYTQNAPLSRILNPGLGLQENELTSLQAVPNPFDGTFSLNFETISNEPVSLKVYDMIGKLIYNRIVDAISVNTLRIGEEFQAGIYNLTVAQGEKMQTVRVIKK